MECQGLWSLVNWQAGSLPLAPPGKPITTSTLLPYQWVVFLQWNLLMLGCDGKVLVGGWGVISRVLVWCPQLLKADHFQAISLPLRLGGLPPGLQYMHWLLEERLANT